MSRMSQAVPSLRQLTPPASLLLVAAAGAWVGVVLVARHMGSMPGTMGLGAGSFVAVWALMMAAMMLPSVAPFASLYSRSFTGDRGSRLGAFASGYLIVWTLAALPAYGLAWLAGDETVSFRAKCFDRARGAAIYTLNLPDELASHASAASDLTRLCALIADGRLDGQVELECSWRQPGPAIDALLSRRIGGKAVLHVD